MISDRWLLPEGVDEVLPPDADRLEHLRRVVLDLYSSWDYQLVIPPFIEYLESLLVGTGSDLDLKTFKLTDQLTGRLMGIRADIPIVLCTGFNEGLSDEQAKKIGIKVLEMKPLEMRDLARTVRRVLDESRLSSPIR